MHCIELDFIIILCFRLHTVSRLDINECLERKVQCPGRCENTIGSFKCIMKTQQNAAYEACPPGYRWDARTKVCTGMSSSI